MMIRSGLESLHFTRSQSGFLRVGIVFFCSAYCGNLGGLFSCGEQNNAWADESELTLGVAPTIGLVLATDPLSTERAPPKAMAAMSLRVLYGISDRLRADAELGFWQARKSTFRNVPSQASEDQLVRGERGARGNLGLTATFGVRWIPTVSIGLGIQYRNLFNTKVISDGKAIGGPADRRRLEFVSVLGAGIARRFDRHWALEVKASGVVNPLSENAVYLAVQGGLSLNYYFYP